MASKGKIIRSIFSYMELAEAGTSTAMLNGAILLDKYKKFDSDAYLFSKDVRHENPIDLNGFLAFNFFKMAMNHHDTKDEAIMKLADYYYYGMSPIPVSQVTKAAKLFKYIEQSSSDSELKGQALFNLGLIYHFGHGKW